MKTFIAALGLAALVSAQASLPACAQSCAINAIGNTGCAITDAACICTKPDYLTESQTCIEGACGPADQQAALEFAINFCGGAGITLSVDTGAAPTATPTPESSAPASSAPTATTEETPASTPAPESSLAPESTPAASSPPVSQSSDSQTPTSTVAPATLSDAAMPLQKNIAGGLGALALGIVAAL